MGASWAAWRSFGLVACVGLPTLMAGCGGKSFEEAVPAWRAGFRWEWSEEERSIEEVTGTVPPFLEEEFDRTALQETCRQTRRLEVFTSNLTSEDGVGLYAAGVLVSLSPGQNQTGSCSDRGWDPAYFTGRDLNEVFPVRVDFARETIKVADEDRGRNEERKFDFPLKNGKQWLQRDEDREATTEYRVVKKETRTVPAGSFDAVRLFAKTVPDEAAVIEREIRGFFASQGASLSALEFDIGLRQTYWFAPQAAYIIEEEDVQAFVAHAAGTDSDGNSFDFTYQDLESTTLKLTKYELTPGLERPLSFLAQLSNYEPPPITPLANFVPEIVVSVDGLDVRPEDETQDARVEFRLRVFNTTAGEEKLRAPESDYPVVASSNDYDAQRIGANWSFSRDTETGKVAILEDRTGGSVFVRANEFGGPGRIHASVTIWDTQNQVNLSSDTVVFEAFWQTNISVEATADNATQGYVATLFPVGWGARQVDVRMRFSDASSHPLGALRVYDSEGARVRSETSSRSRFFASELEPYQAGDWEAQFLDTPPIVGTTYTFDATVRYRELGV